MAQFQDPNTCDLSFEDEEVFIENSGTAEEVEFDMCVGAIEEILMDESFVNTQNTFCVRHCDKFEDTEENKMIYTSLFEEYTELMENMLNSSLEAKIPGFSMSRFETLLKARQEELSAEIFDLLMALGDFSEFKDMMLSYKRQQNSASSIDNFKIAGSHV